MCWDLFLGVAGEHSQVAHTWLCNRMLTFMSAWCLRTGRCTSFLTSDQAAQDGGRGEQLAPAEPAAGPWADGMDESHVARPQLRHCVQGSGARRAGQQG